jgi:hypothetical protein
MTSYGLELAWRLRTVTRSECSLSMRLGDRDLRGLRDQLVEARVRIDPLIGSRPEEAACDLVVPTRLQLLAERAPCRPFAPWRSTAFGGGFNWSMQHTRRPCGGRSVADEAKTAHLLLSQPAFAHVGALAEG